MKSLKSFLDFGKILFSKSTLVVLLLLSVFLIFSLTLLFDDPSVWPDESIYGDISYNLLAENRMGTDLWSGLVRGFEYYYLALPPFYLYLSAFWFKLFGFSIITQRLLSVFLGAVALIIFYYLVKRLVPLINDYVVLGLTLLFATDPTFLQRTRLARPEILVVVLFLISLFAFIKAYHENHTYRKKLLLFIAGFISGLSVITHLASIGFTLSLIIFLIFSGKFTLQSLKSFTYFLIGLIIPLAAWMILLYPNFDLFLQQLSLVQLSRNHTIPWYINVYYFPYPYKLNFAVYIFITISFIIFSFKEKKPLYSLVSYLLVFSWIFATIGEIFWYIIYPIVFSYLALAILVKKYLIINTNNKINFLISVVIISMCVFLTYSNTSYYSSKMATYRYSMEYPKFLTQIEESVPPNKVVYLSSIPDAYYAFKTGRNRLYAFPALFSDLTSFENTLNQSDYIIFNGAYIPNPRASAYLDRYLAENSKHIKEITSPYKLFIIELKDIEDRKMIPK